AAFDSKTTDNLDEGTNALYWTDNRFDLALGAKSTTDIAEGSNLYFTQLRVSANSDVVANTSARHEAATVGDSATLDLTIAGQYITGSVIQSGIQTSLLTNDAGFIANISSFDTDNLAEGSLNLYWTADRFNSAFGG